MQMTTGSLKRIGHDAVGFRVRGVCGAQFRQWANAHLSEYLVRGGTIFGARKRRGLRTRRTWRSCDESRTRPSDVVRRVNFNEAA